MTETRKAQHIEICLSKPVSAHYNFWDDVQLVHRALPELNFDSINTRVTLFGKQLKAPLVISAMTGGFKTEKYDAETINGNLAAGAAAAGIGMGVGSQRMAVSDSGFESTYSVVRKHNVPLIIGNIGAPQLVQQDDGKVPLTVDDIKKAVDLIGADIMAVHLNFLQEVCMVDGDLNAEGCLEAIKSLSNDIPLLAKETGAGISREMAVELKNAGVAGIDIGGLGGTSFAAVEKFRAEDAGDKTRRHIGETFWDWGIPSPVSVLEADIGLPIIATGGIRNGLDAARALVLGASAAGIAGRLLAAAVESSEAVEEQLNITIMELKAAMFLMGAGKISDLQERKYILTGPALEWYSQRKEHYNKDTI